MSKEKSGVPMWLAMRLSLFDQTTSIKDLAATLFDEFKARGLKLQTAANYLTHVKRNLITRGLIVNPAFLPTVLTAVYTATLADILTPDQFDALLAATDMGDLDFWKQYRIWSHYHGKAKELDYNEFELALCNTDFFSLDYRVNGKCLSIDAFYKGATDELRSDAKERLDRKLKSPKYVLSPNYLMNHVLSGLYAERDTAAMTNALLLCCGRRPCSLYLYTPEFKCNGNELNYSARYRERTKKKGKIMNLVIPLLAPFKLFHACLLRWHALMTKKHGCFYSATFVNRTRCRIDGEGVAGRMGKSWQTKDLRPLYVAYVSAIHAKEMVKLPFVRAVLGHTELHTSISYTNVILNPNEEIRLPEFDLEKLVDNDKVWQEKILEYKEPARRSRTWTDDIDKEWKAAMKKACDHCAPKKEDGKKKEQKPTRTKLLRRRGDGLGEPDEDHIIIKLSGDDLSVTSA